MFYTARLGYHYPDGYDTIGGLSYSRGRTSIAYVKPSNRPEDHARNVRILQHELSHNYGT